MKQNADGVVVKHSVAIAGHRTSVSLEEPFWDALRRIAERRSQSTTSLIGHIDADRGEQNLSSAIRVFVLRALESEISRRDAAEAAAAVPVPPEGSPAVS